MKVSDEERNRRIAAAAMRDVIGSEFDDVGWLPVWYLSFCDPAIAAGIPVENQRPGGPSWLGACIVPAMDACAAVAAAHRLGCNPGGEVAMFGPFPRAHFKADFVGRLLTSPQECEDAHV